MQAVILAGGKGTRLKPYTLSFPKPLVPIGNYPILEIIIRQLAKSGFKELVISTGYLAQLIEAYCGDGSKWGVKIRYVHEEKPLNTAGALQLIGGLEDNFLVINGDVLTTVDYGALYREHLAKKATATVTATMRETKVDSGVLEVDSSGVMQSYTEKPTYKHLVSMGIYILSREATKLIKKGEAIGMPDLLLRIKADGGKVYCHKTDSYWLDIGRIDDYARAQEEFPEKENLFLGN